MVKRYRLIMLMLGLVTALTGCVTVDSFLENLGLKKTNHMEEQVWLDPINEQYEFIRTGNVRAAPDRNALLLGTLKGGQRFWALGRTSDNWVAIGDSHGGRIGYVHGSLVQKVGTKRKVTAKATKPSTVKKTSQNAGVNLDDMPDNNNDTGKQGVDLDQF